MRLGTNNCTVCGVDEGDWVSSLLIWMSCVSVPGKAQSNRNRTGWMLLIKLMIIGVFIHDNSF